MQRLMVFDRFDAPLFELSELDVFELSRREVVNGVHSLTITTTHVLERGWRVLVRDDRLRWREFVVYGTDETHSSGEKPVGTYYCTWSLQPDLMGTRVSAMPGVLSPTPAVQALGSVLEGTSRWGVGTVTNTATGGASMYDTDGWDAMSTLIANWGGEIDAIIGVGLSGVISRTVNYYYQMGEQTAKRRFDFGADLMSVRRKVADGPLYCRITPRGKGEETGTGGYGRKITIASVNDGKDYLENSQMVPLAKLPDGSGGWEYPTLEVDNPGCETPEELKTWGLSVLEDYTLPRVTYTVDVLQLAREGIDMQGVSLGDVVHIVDAKFNGLRLSGRVVEMVVDELTGLSTKLTIGYLDSNLAGMMASLSSQIAEVRSAVIDIAGGNLSTADYLSRLLERLNADINATGGYTYITEGQGIRTYDRAVSDPLIGSEAASVVEVKGGTIRIANSKTAQGEWEWKTVFTSGAIAANLVTAAHMVTGYIGNASGDFFIDLDNHVYKMPAGAQVGNTTLEDIEQAAMSNIVDVYYEYYLSDSRTSLTGGSWSTTAPTWQDSKYLWTRLVTETPTGLDYGAASCAAGNDGVSGASVSAVDDEWYLSTSDQTPTGGSWSTTQPTWQHNKYLWSRTVTTITDASGGTTTYTTTPILATALNKANEDAFQNARSLANLQTQQAIFDLLTNNGTVQGIFMQNGQLYVNLSYLQGGILVAGGANNVNGIVQVKDANGNVVVQMDRSGINANGTLTTEATNRKTVVSDGRITFHYRDNTSSEWTRSGYLNGVSGASYGSATTKGIRIETGLLPETGTSRTQAVLTINPLQIWLGHKLNGSSTGPRITMDSSKQSNGDGVEIKASHVVLNATPNSVQVSPGLYISGGMTATGTKSRLVSTEDYSDRLLYAYETPTPMFGDLGSGRIGGDGLCIVSIDDIFAETVRTDLAYQVFLQKMGDGDLWVESKSPAFFTVRGTPGLAFDWEVKCRQAEYENLRLEQQGMDIETFLNADDIPDPSEVYGDYAEEMEELLLA